MEIMKEYEIFKSRILYYAVERGKTESIDGNYYDNMEEAYDNACRFLRENGSRFCLTIPAKLFE